ncbi:MAG: hypothetical protein J6C66_07145, partial [Prevotella sp.]|nr:hypothetical protein [Prevotella sp.]
NISAMNANRLFGINNSGLSKSLEKLSSGYAINRAGDNAAGLAVSEKMRAQISGLTQASKNAEDGISMVQTFEGALTETDSILQRLRTLAVQSANGTYQDDVDREAIQLEFDQLNDELNQIADTDFNGVVVLNGGTMADGLKAVGGEFDYANQQRTAKALTKSDVEYNSLENKTWDTTADGAWATWSAGAGEYDRTDPSKAQGPDSVDITFTYGGDGTWKATGCTDGGMTLDNINGTIAYDRNDANDEASNGGFTLTDGTDTYANVVVDATKLVAGDTVTVTFKNPSVKNSAPENAAIATDGVDLSSLTNKGATFDPDSAAVKITNATYTSTNNVTDTAITEDVADLFKALDGATVSVKYTDGAVAATDATIQLTNGTTAVASTATGADLKNEDGETIGKLKGTATGFTVEDANGNELMSFTYATGDATTANDKTNGTVKYTLALDATVYNEGATPSVDIKANGDPAVSKSNSYSASTATLTYQENITLQTGARTKDSVNFTFKYQSDGLGELEADLDCSARGLGTDKLSLADQESANAAIDKIDNAINKVSMVRASFGAMQNRLEHKIAN